MDKAIQNIIKNLEARKIKAKYFPTKDDVKEFVLKEIEADMTVGIGGSMTIKELKLHEELKEKGNTVYWHWLVEPSEMSQTRKKAREADVYLSSTNALTEGGELINIDGIGNRVTSMVYGPKKVIIICGVNKITPDLISAIDRVKKEVCPKNSKRLNLKTPCATTGECIECNSGDRMCNITTIISGKPGEVDLNVYIVGEELGY